MTAQRSSLLQGDHARLPHRSQVRRHVAALSVASRTLRSAGHYWLISGLLLAYPFYGPWNSASAVNGTLRAKDEYIWPLISVWIVRSL